MMLPSLPTVVMLPTVVVLPTVVMLPSLQLLFEVAANTTWLNGAPH